MSTNNQENDLTNKAQSEQKPSNQNYQLFSNILSFLGGFVFFTGIASLVFTSWETLGIIGQVLVLLGGGLVCFIVANLLLHFLPKNHSVGSALHIPGAFLFQFGILYLFYEATKNDLGSWENVFIACSFAVLSLVYFITQTVFKKNIIFLASVYFGTLSVAFLLNFFYETTFIIIDRFRLIQAFIAIVGICYVLLAYIIQNTAKEISQAILWVSGIFLTCSGFFFLSQDFLMLEVLYGLFLVGAIYSLLVSKYIKSAILVMAFLAMFIFYAYLEYPQFGSVILIALGLAMVWVAFALINRLNRKTSESSSLDKE
jgi:hypothetical protein